MTPLIVITRPGLAGTQLQQQLAEQGLDGVHLPGLAVAPIEPDEQQAALARRAHGWLFTSPAAIRFAVPWLQRVALPAHCPDVIAVLSQASATQLTDTFDTSDVQIIQPESGHRSEDLLAHPRLQQLDNECWVIFNAPGGRRLLHDTLQQRGATVEAIHVYQRHPAELEAAALARLEQWPGEVLTLWTSNTAIANLQQQLPAMQWEKIRHGQHLLLSQRQKSALHNIGAGKIHTARAPDNAALCRQLAQLAGQGGHSSV